MIVDVLTARNFNTMDAEARWIVHQPGERKGPVSSSVASGGGGGDTLRKIEWGYMRPALKIPYPI